MKEQFYYNGNLAEYTGEMFLQGNVKFYQVTLLEGHRKGKTEYTSRVPNDPGSQILDYPQGDR